MRGVLDTSVFIAGEQGRQLDSERLPDEAAISVVTLAELELGVHMAESETVRARRLATLRALHTTYDGLPVDEPVASAFAELVAKARRPVAGRSCKTPGSPQPRSRMEQPFTRRTRTSMCFRTLKSCASEYRQAAPQLRG